MKHTQNRRGFTLIELLVVVLIIGILTAIALPQYTTAVEKSRAAEALTLMSAMAGSVERYRLQKDVWPGTNEFAKLDVDLPSRGDGNYGGKSFIMTMNASGTAFVVKATRDLVGDQQYILQTIITENANGTFQNQRQCTKSDGNLPAADDSTEAAQYCYAIAGSHADNF